MQHTFELSTTKLTTPVATSKFDHVTPTLVQVDVHRTRLGMQQYFLIPMMLIPSTHQRAKRQVKSANEFFATIARPV